VKNFASRIAPHLLVLLLATIAGFPLLQGRLLDGHDALFYPPRSSIFSNGLAEGQILPRWSQELAGGYGEPFFNFVAPLFHYLTAVLHLMGLGLITSQQLVLFALLAGSGLSMYMLASEFFGRRGGLVAAAAYMYAPYALLDLYVRAAYSEYSAFAFPPLILWALYRLAAKREPIYAVVGAVAYALLLLCNNPASLIFSPLLGVFSLLLAAQKRSLPTLGRLIGTLLLGMLLSAFFWVPSLGEKSFVQTHKLVEGFWAYRNHFVELGQLLYAPWGYGLSALGTEDAMSFAIGPVHLVIAGFSAVLIVTSRKRFSAEHHRYAIFFLVIAAAGSFMATHYSLFIWGRIVNIEYIQFPWRFLALPALATSLLSAVPFQLIREKRRLSTISSAAVIIIILGFNYSHARPSGMIDKNDDYYGPRTIAMNRVELSTVREYRPKWAEEDLPYAAPALLTVMSGTVEWNEPISSSTRHKLLVTAAEESVVRMNVHFFPGWEVKIDGTDAAVEVTSPHGLMNIGIPEGVHEIEARFVNTPIRTAAEIASLTALGATLVCTFLSVRSYAKSSKRIAAEEVLDPAISS
jgi:hypothetical protein